MHTSGKNQRRFPRIPAEHAVLVKRLGPGETEVLAKTRVVGLGGCMFLNDEPLGEGTAIELLMSVRGQVIKTTARVVYELEVEDGEVEVGVEFLFISDRDRQTLESLFAGKPAH